MSTKTSEPPSGDVEVPEVAAARERLKELAEELQTAPARRVPPLVHLIQRQRVIIMTLEEAHGRFFNPDLHKEIALLGKVQEGGGLEEPGDAEAEELAASTQLAARGITPEGAARLARVLSTAMHGTPVTTPGPSLPPPPPGRLGTVIGPTNPPVPVPPVVALEPDPDFIDDVD